MTSPTAIDLDLQSIRRQFPALALKVEGEPVVYLDNPAGTQVPQRVIDRTTEYFFNCQHTPARADQIESGCDTVLASFSRS